MPYVLIAHQFSDVVFTDFEIYITIITNCIYQNYIKNDEYIVLILLLLL